MIEGAEAAGSVAPDDDPAVLTAAEWADVRQVVIEGDATVRVASLGEGPPLLLINGIGGNIEMWRPLATQFRGRRIVMFDFPGTGGSPPLRGPRRMRGMAQLVVALLDALGLDQVDALGYSWGGALAQQLAHDAPQRVRRLVLAATIPGLGGRPPAPWVIALATTPARYYSRTYLRLAAPRIFGGEARRPEWTSSDHAQARFARPPRPLAYAYQLYAISGWSSRSWLASLPHPALVMAANDDPLAPLANGRLLARRIPGATLHVVRGGHLFLLDQPARSARRVERFLSA